MVLPLILNKRDWVKWKQKIQLTKAMNILCRGSELHLILYKISKKELMKYRSSSFINKLNFQNTLTK